MYLRNKTIFISGASRGIGLAIGIRAAQDGANVVITGKTDKPHQHLPGTIHSAAEAIEQAGGQALPLLMDVRDEQSVQRAVDTAAEHFGGIDVVINSASAIFRTPVATTEIKRWNLMMDIQVRGAFMVIKSALPHLRKSDNPHILNLSPPLNMDPNWFSGHIAYTMSKYAMSMMILGMSEEFRDDNIGCNALWPRVGIATAAIEFAVGDAEELRKCRKPEIMADAAYAIVSKPSRECTGHFFIDDSLLYAEGERDFKKYKMDPDAPWRPGMFIPDDNVPPPGAL